MESLVVLLSIEFWLTLFSTSFNSFSISLIFSSVFLDDFVFKKFGNFLIGFGVGGERLTAADCRWLRFATGCKRVHVTDGGYVRLVHVAYEN